MKDATLFGFSTGGGEVARYIGRHGTKRVKKAGLVSAVPPLMVVFCMYALMNGVPFDGGTVVVLFTLIVTPCVLVLPAAS